MKKCVLVLKFLLSVSWLGAQIIEGSVVDENGSPLPYATIWIEEQQLGTATNLDGVFSLQLGLGTYTMVTKYLGYQPKSQKLTVTAGTQKLSVQLMPEIFDLSQVEVGSDMEDPAFTIMRRAIAKADFHRNQIDGYTVEVYLKGTGRLKGVPRLFRKRILRALEEEGVDTATAFVGESVSEIRYERPNTYHETVKSVFTRGNDFDSSPNSFVQASFYEPEIANAVSPLSPKAFAYYRFQYMGFSTEGEHTINRIKVTPRSKGDHVFEGMLYIVDQDWAIHSLELSTSLLGIRFDLKHIFQAVEPRVWMPINQVYDVSGKVFGFSFEGQYLANFENYEIELNEDLAYVFEVVDSKLEKEKAKELDKKARVEKFAEDPLAGISSQEELTPKTLRKMMRNYEQAEMNGRIDTMINVVGVQSQVVDSLAYQRDSLYWSEIRPIPLSAYEVKGYEVMSRVDSSEKSENNSQSGETDSVTITLSNTGSSIDVDRRTKFKLHHLLLGGRYRLGEKSSLQYMAPLERTHVNTVEGFNTEIGLRYWQKMGSVQTEFGTLAHYGFTNKLLLGQGYLSLKHAEGNWKLQLQGGSDMVQINENKPIADWINDIATLFTERNFMKLLKKDFVGMEFSARISDRWEVAGGISWEEKIQQRNRWSGHLINVRDREYSSNVPVNNEIGLSEFDRYDQARVDFTIVGRPWLKYRIKNGRRSAIDSSTPELSLGIRKTFGAADTEIDYLRTELGINHSWNLGVRGTLSINVLGGVYWGDTDIPFPEFKHFAANLTPFVAADPTETFRLLDYYAFSTSEEYLTVHSHFQFRKLLLTRFDNMRRRGIREALFVNLLETPTSDHYTELGYSINYLFRVFRLEFVTSWQDFKYQNWGIRLGVASNLESLFGF